MEVSASEVVLIAVGVLAAVAAAYWALGYVSQLTPFERLEVISARAVDARTIELVVKNPGVAVTSVAAIELMGRLHHRLPRAVEVGTGALVTCRISLNGDLPAGVVVELVVITSTGKRFPTAFVANYGSAQGPFAGGVEGVNCF